MSRSGALARALIPCFVLLCVVCCGESTATDGSSAGGAEEQAVKKLLPAADEAEGWRPGGAPSVFTGDALFDHINGGADIYFEYGFVALVTEQYKNGDKEVSVEIYRMDDAPAAFGIYSYSRHPTLSPVEVGGDGTIHPNGLFFWQDKYFVDVRQLGAATIFKDDFLALANAVEKKIAATGERPAIVGLLPDENMVERSEVFARGRLAISNQVYVSSEDLFGLEGGESAVIARYRLGRPEFSVIIAQYAGDEPCSGAFARLRGHFLGDSEREEQFAASAMPGKHHAVRRAGSRLIVVANADSEKNALAMLGRIADSIDTE